MVGFFDQISTQVISKWKKVTLIQKRGNKPTQINSQLLKPSFYDYLESFAIWGSNTTSTHLPHGFTPTNTCPTKNSINRYLSYVAFECEANFQITWGSFAHRDQHKKMFKICCPWTAKVTNVNFWFVDWFLCKPIESTLPYLS